MNINKIRDSLEKYKGQVITFKFNGARNQTEIFDASIEETYKSIFIVRLVNDNRQVKSFSYSDVLTDSLEIIAK